MGQNLLLINPVYPSETCPLGPIFWQNLCTGRTQLLPGDGPQRADHVFSSYCSQMFVAGIHLAGASSGWAGCFLEVNGLQALQDQLVIGRFRFLLGGQGRGKCSEGDSKPPPVDTDLGEFSGVPPTSLLRPPPRAPPMPPMAATAATGNIPGTGARPRARRRPEFSFILSNI